MNKKVLIIGHARSGKDTLAEIWKEEFGLSYQSSSRAALEIFMFPILCSVLPYRSMDEAYEDRVNFRTLWFELIAAYNSKDELRLAKAILQKSDAYVGMRRQEELLESIRLELFDYIVWVDASQRIGYESQGSCTIEENSQMIFLDNNGSYEDFRKNAIKLGEKLFF